jgi:hypothetical protein
MADLDVPSGAKVVINVAPWEDAVLLQQAISREMALGAGLNLSTFMMVAASRPVYEAMIKCLARCTYNTEKITPSTFNKKEARADYVSIVTACVKENIGPLEEGLYSVLSDLVDYVKKQADADQKLKSTTV